MFATLQLERFGTHPKQRPYIKHQQIPYQQAHVKIARQERNAELVSESVGN